MTSGEKWTNAWRVLVLCVGIPLLYVGITNQNTWQKFFGWVVLFLGAPWYAISTVCLGLAVIALFHIDTGVGANVIFTFDFGGYAWVVFKILLTVKEARQREEREEQARSAEEAEERWRLKAKKKEQAKICTECGEILHRISDLLSSCESQATDMLRTSRALHGTHSSQAKGLLLHDMASILLGFHYVVGFGEEYIERLWRGIAGRYAGDDKEHDLWSLHDYAKDGDKPTVLVAVLNTYDKVQNTDLASKAASTYRAIITEIASHCVDSVAVKLVTSAYFDLLSRYIREGAQGRRQSHTGDGGVCSRCVEAYQLLGLPLGATEDELKKKRRAWAEVLHPDQLGGKSDRARDTGEEQLKSINSAYDHIFQCRFATASA